MTEKPESKAAVDDIVSEASERLRTGHEYVGFTCHKCGVDHADEWARKPCPGPGTLVPPVEGCPCGGGKGMKRGHTNSCAAMHKWAVKEVSYSGQFSPEAYAVGGNVALTFELRGERELVYLTASESRTLGRDLLSVAVEVDPPHLAGLPQVSAGTLDSSSNSTETSPCWRGATSRDECQRMKPRLLADRKDCAVHDLPEYVPPYNHTREGSAATPCPLCAPMPTPEQVAEGLSVLGDVSREVKRVALSGLIEREIPKTPMGSVVRTGLEHLNLDMDVVASAAASIAERILARFELTELGVVESRERAELARLRTKYSDYGPPLYCGRATEGGPCRKSFGHVMPCKA